MASTYHKCGTLTPRPRRLPDARRHSLLPLLIALRARLLIAPPAVLRLMQDLDEFLFHHRADMHLHAGITAGRRCPPGLQFPVHVAHMERQPRLVALQIRLTQPARAL